MEPTNEINRRPVVATTSLAGCFGCHMSFLDIDLNFLDLAQAVEFHRSPLTDIKTFSKRCDIGLIEGGCCNSENIHTLKEFRKNCDILISLGECAIMGGLPALRNNHVSLKDCFKEAYHDVPSAIPGETRYPNDPDLPKILDKVYPCHHLVKIDYFLPGCPPRADLIWKTIQSLLTGKKADLPYELIKYD